MERASEKKGYEKLTTGARSQGELGCENQTYDAYCARVCAALKKATPKEKSSLSEELLDHMESHAEALMELGWDPEEARTYSIQAMGDPETVGRQYDEKLSSFWLWCGRVLRVVLILYLVYLLWGPAQQKYQDAQDNLQARTDPQWGINGMVIPGRDRKPWISEPVDITIPLGAQWLRIYRLELYEIPERDDYSIVVFTVTYAENPLQATHVIQPKLEREGTIAFDSSNGAIYQALFGVVEEGQPYIGLRIPQIGEDTLIQIPIPWEVTP